MKFKVDLDANEVNAQISKTILESTIGKQIKDSIDRNLKNITEGYNNPISDSIKEVVIQIVKDETLKNEKLIREIVAKSLTSKMIKEFMNKFQLWLNKSLYI